MSLRDVVHGGLLGGAVGDALGAPVEAMLLANIVQRYGQEGVTGGRNSFEGRISEETQLTLFLTEALIRSSVRARARGIGTTLGLVQEGLLVWLRGQGQPLPEQSHPLFSSLERYPELMSNRGPTSSTTKAMRLVAARGQPRIPLGTRTAPITDSKGCAATVRSAPCGFGRTPEHAFELGCDTAALTHGDPSGWLPAGTLAAIVAGLDSGLTTAAAVDRARAILTRHPAHLETSTALTTALRLADEITRHTTTVPPVGALKPLGFGVMGPEALALAVCAALTAEAAGGTPTEIFRAGVLLAVNHSGDSDSTGSIAGTILGARHGVAAIPAEWRTALDAAPIIEHLVADFCQEFGPNPPATAVGTPTDEWFARYPS
ncbi:ADP-ribosylglycohydrolase family protein [Nocardia stercoris]|uniref:ADP-ribosylglycohydrolase family protein n=1 Tax=Nocardia stercoris TaxID=2483361 RepID=A0A3M2LGK6_9NOCA|nr:ADP-ribosylglycohydrolase family protein [Nocardia stercoris]